MLQIGVQLDLIIDAERLIMIERHNIGGLCYVGSQRHVKANAKKKTAITFKSHMFNRLGMQMHYTIVK